MPQPVTVETFMAMNPVQRLQFARQLSGSVTAEVVALLIYTYLKTEMNPSSRAFYMRELRALIAQVDAVTLLALIKRHVNTNSPLRAHKEMTAILKGLQGKNLVYGCIQISVDQGVKQYFVGTFSRKIVPSNLEELQVAGIQAGDCVLYDNSKVIWNRKGTHGSVAMTRVLVNNNMPSTLGL